MTEKTYHETYDDFWKPIVENSDGTLNKDRIKRELADYYFLMDAVPKVYNEITNGKISKLTTLPETVISVYIDELKDLLTEALEEKKQELLDEIEVIMNGLMNVEVNVEAISALKEIKQTVQELF